jgi:hypothetical protein
MFGDTIVISTQTSNVIVGYSFVTAGSDSIVDSNYVAAEVITAGSTGTMAISSLLHIDEVQSVYVLLNGRELQSSEYILAPSSSVNNRAMITVTGLESNFYNLEAWFFDNQYPKFNRIHEQFFTIGSTAIILLWPPWRVYEPMPEIEPRMEIIPVDM